MDELRDKSHFNRESAALLIRHSYYAPSIHCSYYSCIQLMLHLLYEKLKRDKKKYEELRRLSHQGTHAFIINETGKLIIAKDKPGYIKFQKEIIELKELREDSDYQSVIIGQSAGLEAFNKSDRIKGILSRNI